MLTMPSVYIPISIPIPRSRPRPFGEKSFRYFIGYKDDHGKVMSLCIMLPKMRHVEEILMKLNIHLF